MLKFQNLRREICNCESRFLNQFMSQENKDISSNVATSTYHIIITNNKRETISQQLVSFEGLEHVRKLIIQHPTGKSHDENFQNCSFGTLGIFDCNPKSKWKIISSLQKTAAVFKSLQKEFFSDLITIISKILRCIKSS